MPVNAVPGVDAGAALEPLRHRLHLGHGGKPVALVMGRDRACGDPRGGRGSHGVVERGVSEEEVRYER